MIICQKVNATAHCVLESGKKCIAGEALLAQHDVKKKTPKSKVGSSALTMHQKYGERSILFLIKSF